MNCFRFANVKSDATVINTFNTDDNNIAYIKTQHCQINATVT